MANTPQRSYRIPVDLLDAIRTEAHIRHCSATDVLVRALREHFQRGDEIPAPRKSESYEYQEMPIA